MDRTDTVGISIAGIAEVDQCSLAVTCEEADALGGSMLEVALGVGATAGTSSAIGSHSMKKGQLHPVVRPPMISRKVARSIMREIDAAIGRNRDRHPRRLVKSL